MIPMGFGTQSEPSIRATGRLSVGRLLKVPQPEVMPARRSAGLLTCAYNMTAYPHGLCRGSCRSPCSAASTDRRRDSRCRA